MSKKALIVWGGWNGHEPEKVATIIDRELKKAGVQTVVSNTLDSFLDESIMQNLDLIVPCWTMGEIKKEQMQAVSKAVVNGTGMGGLHGGMCDAFRTNCDWQFITGGQFIGHPGNDGTKYNVRITAQHFITTGLSDFELASEQYYMHVDPANRVLATTRFPVVDGPHVANGTVDMPVAWTRHWGKGRVFYHSLGHVANIVELPPVLRLTVRGLLWAANAEALAQ